MKEARRDAADDSMSASRAEREPARQHFAPPREERRDFKPASSAAVADAIAEVNHIIASLNQVLDEMEEVLETLELAEVQKTADEREIEALRHALRQLERRGPEPRHEAQGPPPQRREPRRHGRR